MAPLFQTSTPSSLTGFFVSDPASTNIFWRAHPGIERLELWAGVEGNWFDKFEVGMLPNLLYLQVIKSSRL